VGDPPEDEAYRASPRVYSMCQRIRQPFRAEPCWIFSRSFVMVCMVCTSVSSGAAGGGRRRFGVAF
jgi:hypothetical protein